MNGIFLWPANRVRQYTLELEPALRLVQDETEAAHKLGELDELGELGVGMHTPQEVDVMFGQRCGDCLVSRQHEFLDDLVALIVSREMSTLDLPVIVQLDLDLGKIELERAAVPSPAAKDHRQL